jgi:CheY-like chemotaxis protein
MTQDGRRVRVWVVDDHQVIADTLASILQRSGYEATAAYSGEQAVEAAIASNIDALITDIVMGGMSGIEAAIRILRDHPDCKIILFSGQSTTANLLQESEAQGYHFDILAKPINPTILLDLLAVWQRAQDALPSNLGDRIRKFLLSERVDMQSGQYFVLFLLVVVPCVAAGTVGIIRSRSTSSRREGLKRRLRKITIHDQAKANRLIEFERTELIRKRRPKENLDDLMERAIQRWERDNVFAVSIY